MSTDDQPQHARTVPTPAEFGQKGAVTDALLTTAQNVSQDALAAGVGAFIGNLARPKDPPKDK